MNKKAKMAACALSAALMITTIGGTSIAQKGLSGVAGVEVQAATRKSEANLRKIVLSKYPGKVMRVEKDYDDGIYEYTYKVRQKNGVVVKIDINQFGRITDVEREGQFVNGVFQEWDD